MATKVLEYIHFLETHNGTIASFRCDNAGENIKFKEKLEQMGKNINVEFLAPHPPSKTESSKGHLQRCMIGYVQL